MSSVPIQMVSLSHRGRVRDINEDAVATLPEQGAVILADGMGGYNAGEVASQLAVETIGSYIREDLLPPARQPILVPAVAAANQALFRAVEISPELQGMATTVVAGVFQAGRLHYAHVGDSRIYRIRDDQLCQLTRDHSMIQELVDQGMFESLDEARAAGVKNNVLMRGLGVEPLVQVDESAIDVQAGDRFLFCSDGLSNMVSEQEMAGIFAATDTDIQQTGERLLRRALENGGLDNVSLVLVRSHG